MATTLGKSNSGAAFGRSIPRVEARAKVTGKAEYVHNLRLPGMLYGKVHRSTVAHGRIRGIDVAAAKALPVSMRCGQKDGFCNSSTVKLSVCQGERSAISPTIQ